MTQHECYEKEKYEDYIREQYEEDEYFRELAIADYALEMMLLLTQNEGLHILSSNGVELNSDDLAIIKENEERIAEISTVLNELGYENQ